MLVLVILTLIIICLISYIVINYVNVARAKISESMVNISEDSDNLAQVPIHTPLPKAYYTDSFGRNTPVYSNLVKNPYFGEYYEKWWVPKSGGRDGDWQYSNPYWFPANFGIPQMRDTVGRMNSTIYELPKQSEAERERAFLRDMKMSSLPDTT